MPPMLFRCTASRRARRETGRVSAGLPGKRLQHEHSMVSIQDAPVVLAPGAKARSGFFGWFEADKPDRHLCGRREEDRYRAGPAGSRPARVAGFDRRHASGGQSLYQRSLARVTAAR